MNQAKPEDKMPPVAVRVLSAFYVKGQLARPGAIVELDPFDARELIACEKAEPVQN